MKSAYELALERMEREGIRTPDATSLSDEDRAAMAEIRRRTDAKLAELELSHRGGRADGPLDDEGDYLRERQRLEAKREDDLEAIRRRAAAR
ncbi:MAG: hypothetical protein AAGN46_13280 [Acidobacteriota bacterium]